MRYSKIIHTCLHGSYYTNTWMFFKLDGLTGYNKIRCIYDTPDSDTLVSSVTFVVTRKVEDGRGPIY